jgi:hypothetical protein
MHILRKKEFVITGTKEGEMKKRPFLMKIAITVLFMLSLITVAQANPINLALTGTATQSSTYASYHAASNAIDGNTNGNYYGGGSFTHTAAQDLGWWKVDLGDMFELDQIVLWNRTDAGLGYRLSNFNVSVLDKSNITVWTNNFFTSGGYPNPSLTIDLPDNTIGQIIKVSLNAPEYLSLAEVQVFAAPEPGTMLLLGLGLVGLAGVRRKFQK